MKRREIFKKMSLLALVGLSSMTFVSCADETVKTETVSTIEAAVIPETKSDRDVLIINRQIMTIADSKSPTQAELKHTPEITFGEKDTRGHTLVKITIGQEGVIHPATEDHWSDYLKVYINDKLVIDTEFANGGVRGFGYYYLVLEPGDIVTAEAGCNLHGIWEHSVTFN